MNQYIYISLAFVFLAITTSSVVSATPTIEINIYFLLLVLLSTMTSALLLFKGMISFKNELSKGFKDLSFNSVGLISIGMALFASLSTLIMKKKELNAILERLTIEKIEKLSEYYPETKMIESLINTTSLDLELIFSNAAQYELLLFFVYSVIGSVFLISMLWPVKTKGVVEKECINLKD